MALRHGVTRAALVITLTGVAGAALAQPLQLGGTPCARPPVLHCPDQGCTADTVTNGGPVVEPQTGRSYFLDYPCNLRRGDDVTVILSLHGGGSYGNWQRHYFPLLDYVDKYRLVVATPYSPRRVWGAEDDAYLQNIVTAVIEQVGRDNIKAFWLAGHSQGGLTSTRIVCSDFFKTKVDGFLSLSGGRIGGQAGRAAELRRAAGVGRGTDGDGERRRRRFLPAALVIPPPPTCDFSHIFETGEHEISALPTASERAKMYGCAATTQAPRGGRHQGRLRLRRHAAESGLEGLGAAAAARHGRDPYLRGCRDKRVVADVVRLDKGHTEGLEPRVTEELVKMMLAARGGKIQHGG